MAAQDVAMKPVAQTDKAQAANDAKAPVPVPELLLALLRHNLALVHRSVVHLEARFSARALRSLPTTRRRIAEHPDVLARVIEEATEQDSPVRHELLRLLPAAYVPVKPEPAAQKPSSQEQGSDAMDVDAKDSAKDKEAGDAKATASDASAAKPSTTQVVVAPADTTARPSPDAQPEMDAYLRLLVITLLVDQKKESQALDLSRTSVQSIVSANRRTLDQLLAKTAFYLARALELTSGTAGLASERSSLLSLHLTSSLRHDAETTATVLNLLLRSYIVEGNLYDQADKLVARAPFPRAQASNANIARYEYWVGRIRAVQLNYTEAHQHLQQAIRRGPQPMRQQNAKATALSAAALEGETKKADQAEAERRDQQTGAGFLQTAYKFLVVVELLMGDIPERSIFRLEFLKKALAPYLEIVQAVRVGDLSHFQHCLTAHTNLFQRDATYSLILRLRHNVIKTGIRMISLSYSRISLLDITRKLGLESEEDAEYIVAKAIRDGVIEAKVDHEKGWMISEERRDVYSTGEPRRAFETRIEWCLGLRNESVKAMRYPMHGGKAGDDLANAEKEAREREREMAEKIGDLSGDEDDGDWI
ncbi:unnamed protein product [Parajaminaea phylloscopi]